MYQTMYQKSRKFSQGFTLVELLVVITIIGVLATVVMVSLNSARVKARDIKRIADVRQVALALEFCYDQAGKYLATAGFPAAGAAMTCGSTTPISAMPADPSTGVGYVYGVDSESNPQKFVLRATLEDLANSALSNDVDGTVYTIDCTDTSAAPNYCLQQ